MRNHLFVFLVVLSIFSVSLNRKCNSPVRFPVRWRTGRGVFFFLVDPFHFRAKGIIMTSCFSFFIVRSFLFWFREVKLFPFVTSLIFFFLPLNGRNVRRGMMFNLLKERQAIRDSFSFFFS